MRRPSDDHREDDEGDAEHQHAGELGRQREQIDDPAEPGREVAQGDRDRRADDLLEDGGVGGQPGGDFGRAILLEEAGRQAQQIALHRAAQVGDGALADPGDEIEAQPRSRARGRRRSSADSGTSGDDVAAAGPKPRSMTRLKP